MRPGLAVTFAVAVCLQSAVAQAQSVSAPTPAAGTPDQNQVAIRYAVGVDGNLALGVVDRFLINARGDAQVTTPLWGVYIEPRYTYARVNDNATDSEYYLRAVGYLFPRSRLYGFVVGLGERSLRRQYDYRLTGGLGAGTNLVRTPRVELLVNLGAVAETTEFERAEFEGRPEETSTQRTLIRVATRASGRLRFTERGSAFFDVYFKPNVTDPGDYRILGKLAFDLALADIAGGQLSARALLDYTRETVVVVGTSRDELMLGFGIGLRRD